MSSQNTSIATHLVSTVSLIANEYITISDVKRVTMLAGVGSCDSQIRGTLITRFGHWSFVTNLCC